MNGAASTTTPERNYAAFDQELTHQALNVRLFLRLLTWTKPYRITLIASAVLIIVGSGLSSLTPVLQNRIIIDEILAPNPEVAEMPHYHLKTVLSWLTDTLPIDALTAAILMFVAMFVVQTFLQLAQQLLLTSGALKTLRDLRIDLFASLERKPASFYDHVAVGRVMTRVTNDVENLFELLVGFVGRAGVVFPFFISLAIMLDMSIHLTSVGLAIIPFAAVATYYFRKVMRQIFRRIRDSVSALNQYMQEDLIGIEVVQISGREPMNSAEYGELNRANRRHEFHAINYEVVFETFNMSQRRHGVHPVVRWRPSGAGIHQSRRAHHVHPLHQHDDPSRRVRRPVLQYVVPVHGVGRTHLPSARLGRAAARANQSGGAAGTA